MKIRTVDQLLDKISRDRVWRIREISALRSQCHKSDLAVDTAKALRRSFVPMAYAHWEGFVKRTTNYYVEYVAMQRLRLGELSPAFMSLYLWREHSLSLNRGKSSSLIDVCESILNKGDAQVHIRYKDEFSTSNLNARTLKEICLSLGVPYANFATKEFFIDASLLDKRNHIAHGELNDIDLDAVELIKNEVVALIDNFRAEIENAAVSGGYRKAVA